MRKRYSVIFALTLLTLMILPEAAFASGGIGEFTSPLEKVMNTLTGTGGKILSTIAFALCGLFYIFNKDDITGAFKMMAQVVLGIAFIAFAGSIVGSVFTFSGAAL